MKNFEGFIFDIDGTLTSTNELIFATFRHVVEKHLNKSITDEEIVSQFGPTEEVILKEWMKEKYDEARADYFNFYTTNHHLMADIYPGIKEVLQMIKEAGLPISIYTGKGRESSEITLKQIGVYEYFNMIVTGDDVADHKPSPEGITRFVENYNLNKEKVLMIGDAPADVLAARSAGVKVASVVWDSYAKDRVLTMESDYLFNTVEELSEFLRENLNGN